jgi:hypothetical protein
MGYEEHIEYYDVDSVLFSWFCGLFEAEGSISFAAPAASKGQSQIKLSMSDRDVVERAAMFTRTSPSSYRQRGYDYSMFRVSVVGFRAIEMLKLMMPHLGKRRQARAAEVISSFSYSFRLPLKRSVVSEIERLLKEGELGTRIAERLHVGNSVVSAIKHGKHYTQLREQDYKLLVPRIQGEFDTLAWLAGLLEGDGAFIDRPGKYPQIGLNMKDEDVVKRAAQLLDGNATYDSPRDRWQVTKSGSRAVAMMQVLLSLMGQRRTQQILKIFRTEESAGRGGPERRLLREEMKWSGGERRV